MRIKTNLVQVIIIETLTMLTGFVAIYAAIVFVWALLSP